MILLTFFDDAYLAQGQVMLRSFMQHTSERFKMCVLWLGKRDALSGDHNIEVVTLNQFINSESRLFKASDNRSYQHFCWTLEPALVHSCLKAQKDGAIIVYCDADMFWFADPVPAILGAMERADVALSRHHFPNGQEHRERTCGIFNFGCGVFRACDLTRRVVGEWLDQTLTQCDETQNDQHLLDQWPAKLGDRLTELPIGMNLGPWSMPEAVRDIDGNLLHMKIGTQHTTIFPLISMHFHEFRRGIGRNQITLKGEAWNRTHYELHPSTIESVYRVYERELEKFL